MIDSNTQELHTVKNKNQQKLILSFGLGNKTMKHVIEILQRYSILHAVDVRDFARQEKNKRFSPNKLSKILEEANMRYHNLSGLLGERPDYRMFMLSSEFSSGINQISEMTREGKVAIFCSETDFNKCHRKLIASRLSREGFRVQHISANTGKYAISQITLENVAQEMLQPKRRAFTIGFTKKSMRNFAELLNVCRITRVVDIRLRPVSQYSGFAKQDDLEFLLELLKIEYLHLPLLAPDDDLLDKYRKDGDWRYYESKFMELLRKRRADVVLRQIFNSGGNICFLCTEDSPQKCHRGLVAEYTKNLLPEVEIIHITSTGIHKETTLQPNLILDNHKDIHDI